MFEIKVKGEFDAAHRVAGYPGKCDRLHGHSWTVELSATGQQLDELGMLVDFKRVRGALMEVLDTMDHQYLNELPPFREVNPTAENLARYIYQVLAKQPIFGAQAHLQAVCVWESPHSSVTYSEGV